MITAMTDILNITATALVLLAGLAALLQYVRRDTFSGPFSGPRSEFDAREPRDAQRELSLP